MCQAPCYDGFDWAHTKPLTINTVIDCPASAEFVMNPKFKQLQHQRNGCFIYAQVAAHNAHRGILGGEADAALAAGVNVMLWQETTAGICQLQVRARWADLLGFSPSQSSHPEHKPRVALTLTSKSTPSPACRSSRYDFAHCVSDAA